MRPKSLFEVAQLAAAGDSFDRCLANFLDEFYSAPSVESLATAPALLVSSLGNSGLVKDAYLAATAEELSRAYHFPMPAWAFEETRKLRHPFFASELASLRA